MRCALMICLLGLPLSIGAGEPARRPLTPEDLWACARVGAPTLSPDGRWACVAVSRFVLPSDEPKSELWLLSTDGSTQRQLTTLTGRHGDPQWSPDGKNIAFVSLRAGDEVAQIYVIDPRGGEARRLTKLPFAPIGLKWGADNRAVFCIAWVYPDAPTDEGFKKREAERKDRKSKAEVITDGAYRYWDHSIADGKRPQLFRVDAATGEHRNLLAHCGRCLPPYEPSSGDYDVRPDGNEICFVSENVKEIGLDNNNDLFTLDITKANAEPNNLTAGNPANDLSPAYSPDGRTLAYCRQRVKFFYADTSHLVFRNLQTGHEEEAGFNRPVSHPRWQGGRVIAEVESDGYNLLKPFTPDGDGGQRAMTMGHSDRAVCTAGSTLAYLRSSFDMPPQLFAQRESQRIALDHFNDELRAKWDLGRVESRTFAGAHGDEVQMWIVYPPGFDSAKKWPLVQVVHGGPHNAIHTDWSYRWNPQLWASQGWVIGIVNFHGSSGFGQKFTDSITGDLPTMAAEDVLKATEWFATQPWIDKERIATAGASYGGYMMAWLNGTAPGRFKTMVCHAGVYNWHSMMASDLVRGRERSLGAPPWGDLAKIDRQSPQRLAANFSTPTLVLHGEKDYRVPVTQGLEYYSTLRQKGVPTRLVLFPDENHWILKPNNSLLWHREVFGWLKQSIGSGPTK